LPLSDTASPGKKQKERRCIASGAVLTPEAAALRFVRSPDNVLMLDVNSKLPGRGAWVTADRQQLLTALKKGAFARALKVEVHLPADTSPQQFADEIQNALQRQALNALGLLKRGGFTVSGYEKVKAGLEKGKVAAYIHASDAGDDGVSRLLALCAAAPRPIPVINLFAGAHLDIALGTTNMVHLALTDAKPARNFLQYSKKLAGFVHESTETA
jgi:hypothetical protein